MEKNFIKIDDNTLINIHFIKVIERLGKCIKICDTLSCYGNNVKYICKNDYPEGYEKLLSHRMIFVKPSYENAKVDSVMIPKDASDIMLTSDAIEQGKCFITYQIAGSSFTML